MVIKPTEEKEYKDLWYLIKGSILQSWNWGQAKKYNWGVKYLKFSSKEGKAEGEVMILFRRIPFINKCFGYIARGIFVRPDSFEEALNSIWEYVRKNRLAFILIDPENNLEIKDWNTSFKKALENCGFIQCGATIQPNQTNVIWLPNDEDRILEKMDGNYRRNIKKAVRHGVMVTEETSEEGLSKFYDVLNEIFKNTKYVMHGKKYFDIVFKELYKDGLVRILLAKLDDNTLGGYFYGLNANTAYELYGGVTKEGRNNEAGYLLKWEAIKYFKKIGLVYYDQWGVAPQNVKNHPLYSITNFKKGFGGKYIEYLPQHVKILDKNGWMIYQLGNRLNKILIKIKASLR